MTEVSPIDKSKASGQKTFLTCTDGDNLLVIKPCHNDLWGSDFTILHVIDLKTLYTGQWEREREREREREIAYEIKAIETNWTPVVAVKSE